MAGRILEGTWFWRIPFHLRDLWTKHVTATCRASPPDGQLIRVIKREQLSKSTSDPKITDCDYVASYSWMDTLTPTIIVPGTPPMWTPPPTEDEPKEYKSSVFHPQATKYPIYPMEPAVRAVREQNPDFPAGKIDIFTSADVVADLFRFISGAGNDFQARYIMETIGDTVFIFRRSEPQVQLVHDILGKIHTFREQYAVWEEDVQNSVSHQRIIRYKFGGLDILVCSEVDGYFNGNDAVPAAQDKLDMQSSVNTVNTVLHDERAGPRDCQSLEIKREGKLIFQKNIFSIHSRFAIGIMNRTRKIVDKTDTTSLWASQTPSLILGLHRREAVGDFQIQDQRKVVAEWEKENEDHLRRFASLLHELVKSTRAESIGLELCQNMMGQLEVRHESKNKGPMEEADAENGYPMHSDDDFERHRVLMRLWVRDSIQDGGPHNSRNNDEKNGRRTEEGTSEIADVLRRDDDVERNRDYTISPSDSGQDADSERSSLGNTVCSTEACGYCGHCSDHVGLASRPEEQY